MKVLGKDMRRARDGGLGQNRMEPARRWGVKLSEEVQMREEKNTMMYITKRRRKIFGDGRKREVLDDFIIF